MKKMLFIAMMAAGLCMVSCQKAPEAANVAEEKAATENVALNNWNLAMQLAAYGYENESASALLEAAKILMTVNTEALEVEAEEVEVKDETKEDKPAVTVEQLLLDAAEFGACPAAIEALSGAEVARGAVGGAKVLTDRVYSHSNNVYYCDFRGGEFACVAVTGDHDTDLDLYIYDQNNNLIAYDEDYTDNCIVTFTPSWTGRFYMKVVNRGSVYNNFALATN